MGTMELIALSMGVAWASGVNLYATLGVLGLMGATGNIDLPPDLEILTNPMVIFAAIAMYVIEFFADKIPGVDTTWDMLHTFVRIPAGALLAAGAVGDISPAAGMAALILGGGLAGASHGIKAGSRVLINASPEPFTNWAASTTEDAVVVGGLMTALYNPLVFIALVGIFVLLAIWLLPKLWRGIRGLFRRMRQMFGGASADDPDAKPSDASSDGAGVKPAASVQEAFEPGLLPDAGKDIEPEKPPG
jgi:Domain of unknown function (DUF4126)